MIEGTGAKITPLLERLRDGERVWAQDPQTATGLSRAFLSLADEEQRALWATVAFDSWIESEAYDDWLFVPPKPKRRAVMLPPQPTRALTLGEALDSLERVRRIGPNRWIARCPAHEDRSPSLVVWEHQDKPGIPAFHCYAGCSWQEVRQALVC